MEWLKNNQLKIDRPKKPKKITGTRFATILGYNPWSTPFEIWCEITKTYQKPFVDTIYTRAGKTIEPKQIAYMKRAYAMNNLRTPTDLYGTDYFKKTWGDFYHENPVLGGMWDSLLVDENGKTTTVIEFKTTKRSEDWAKDVPDYYAMQAALYAHLLGVDDVIMVASFLKTDDYEHPENYQPNVTNTITVEFKVSQRYPDFDLMVEKANKWWEQCVVKGVSPVFDENKDAEILKILRTNTVSASTDIKDIIREAEIVRAEIDAAMEKAGISPLEKKLKQLTEQIKQYALSQFRDGDKKVSLKGSMFNWEVTRSVSSEINKDALSQDGLLEKYTMNEDSYRISSKPITEE